MPLATAAGHDHDSVDTAAKEGADCHNEVENGVPKMYSRKEGLDAETDADDGVIGEDVGEEADTAVWKAIAFNFIGGFLVGAVEERPWIIRG